MVNISDHYWKENVFGDTMENSRRRHSWIFSLDERRQAKIKLKMKSHERDNPEGLEFTIVKPLPSFGGKGDTDIWTKKELVSRKYFFTYIYVLSF